MHNIIGRVDFVKRTPTADADPRFVRLMAPLAHGERTNSRGNPREDDDDSRYRTLHGYREAPFAADILRAARVDVNLMRCRGSPNQALLPFRV